MCYYLPSNEFSFIIIMQKQPQEEQQQNLAQQDSPSEHQDHSDKKEMSKSQLKKLARKQHWQKLKIIKRQEKREKQKEKKKMKKLEQLQNAQNNPGQQIEKVHTALQQHLLTRKRKQDYAQKMKEGLKVVIDLQFYDLMTQKEQNSLLKQLGYCHSVNRKCEKPFNYILTSTTPDRKDAFTKGYNADKWGIALQEASLTELFPKQRIVYLSGDATEDIEQFEQDLVYVIGGIVDHNRLKKITYNYAIENEIKVRRLPMKTVHLKASVHLAVNHVWEWMLKKYNGCTWDQALKAVIPSRKLQG